MMTEPNILVYTPEEHEENVKRQYVGVSLALDYDFSPADYNTTYVKPPLSKEGRESLRNQKARITNVANAIGVLGIPKVKPSNPLSR